MYLGLLRISEPVLAYDTSVFVPF